MPFHGGLAKGDPSNISNMSAGDSIPEWRLVPYDNNIGQRNIFPAGSLSGAKDVAASMDGLEIQVKNPHNVAARMIVKAVLPKFMVKAGWKMSFANPGAGAFTLKPGGAKTVVLQLDPGEEFGVENVREAKEAMIHIETFANGILVGGMSYELDPQLKGSTEQ